MPKKLGEADGKPRKVFFVRMITRDITLEDCILDLIDNSVDGAWKCEGGLPTGLDAEADLSSYQIDIVAKPGEFSITDNCGGITLEEAENYAFTFGRSDADDGDDFSIGVYGIGMKRAVFKMGRAVLVQSTYRDAGKLAGFKVPIDVAEWLKPENANVWDFPIYAAKPKTSAGVFLKVEDLTAGTEAQFSDARFLRDLHRTIARDYTLHLHYGLKITLNGKPVAGASLTLRVGG